MAVYAKTDKKWGFGIRAFRVGFEGFGFRIDGLGFSARQALGAGALGAALRSQSVSGFRQREMRLCGKKEGDRVCRRKTGERMVLLGEWERGSEEGG